MAKKTNKEKEAAKPDLNTGTETLSRLVEQAASKITLLDPADSRDLQDFNCLFEAMQAVLQDGSDLPADRRDHCRSLTEQGALRIAALLQEESENSTAAVEQISAAVAEIQQLLQEAAADLSSEVTPAPTPAAEPAPQAAAFLEEDIPLIQDFIAESREHIENAESALLELENQPDNQETLNQIFRGFHTIKGMAGFLNLTDISTLAHASENLLDQGRKGNLKIVGVHSDIVFSAIDLLKSMLTELEKCLEAGRMPSTPSALGSLIDKLQAAAEGKLQTEEAKDQDLPPERDQQLDAVLQDQPTASAPSRSSDGQQEKIKVSTKRLDDLINMTGELSVAQLMISEEVKNSFNSDNNLFRKVALQNKIVRELQELSMAMRMIPIQGAFQRMGRLVRDLSHKAKKDVQLVTFGEETELDRNIVDKITDPLIHMMRNSVDHGIEPAEERKAQGKRPQGTIRLSAFHQAGNIVVEIQDDGRGLNRDKILAKAREKGLLAEGQDLSDEEAFRLIFHPGFSTADKITDVSGRGVGMDVVRKNIEALGGKIDIRSVLGQGTTFTIHLPLTLAIIDGQIVTIGSQRYIVPINSVVQSIRPAADQISTVQGRGRVVMLRGELIPLLPLHELFNIPDAVQDPAEGLLMVVADSSRKCCLQVDHLLGQQQIVIKSLNGMGKIKGISGGSIMGDGRVSLILDIPALLEMARRQTLECAGEPA